MITRLQGVGGCPEWPQKGLRNICTAPYTNLHHFNCWINKLFYANISVFRKTDSMKQG